MNRHELLNRSGRFLFLIAVLAAFILSPTLIACAQDLDDVTITGQITDENGAIIPGATVTAVLQSTNEERTVQANDEGRYRIIELDPGTYTIRAANAGFATEEKRDLVTVAGQNVQLNFTMKPAAVTAEQVVVSEADAPAVDTTRTVVGGTVMTEEIESLPNNSRSPLDLIFTLGGVSEEPLSTRDLAEDRGTNARNTPEEAGVFALSGGPAYSNNITIDGLDNNDDRAARERFQPSLEAVEEVQVITNQFSAEYGRASGGRLNLRTRAGTKRYSGRAFMFFRDDILNANTFRNKLNGLPRLPLTEYNPGFTFGGPLKLASKLPLIPKNSTFFFVGFEYRNLTDTANVDTVVPVLQNTTFPLPAPTTLIGARPENGVGGALVAPFFVGVTTPFKNMTLTARVDQNFTNNHNGTINYQMGRQKNLRGFGGGNRLAEALIGRTRNTDAISYSDNFIFSAKAVNQFRFQFSRLTPAVEAQGGRSPVILISLSVPAAAGDPIARSGTLIAGSSTTGATDRREIRFQAQEAFSYIAGRHSLKFGGDVQNIKSTFIDLSDASGTFNFDNVAAFLSNTPSRFRQNFQTESTQKNTYFGIFFQDEWRLKSNFVLSYGLRYERETILPDNNNWGPRVAVAYDPFKTGKTVIRLGGGIFYNRVLLRTVDDFTLGGQQLFLDTNAIPTTQRAQFFADFIRFPNVLTADSPAVQQFASRNTGFLRRLDPNLVIPESYQTNIGFERELGGKFVFEANYTWNRGIHLWREFNANAPILPAGFRNFTDYLLSRDFLNLQPCPGCSRPLFNGTGAGEFVRFTTTGTDPNNASAVGRIIEFGVPITLINVNSIFGANSASQLVAALGAVNSLRPDPTRTEIEQLASIGNSFYHGLVLELRRRFTRTKLGLNFSFRAAYTFSFLKDDGIVNTSDALRPGDFRGELSRSVLDRRHRFALSGTFDLPKALFKLRLSPILRISSGAPFNISIGGIDRNLDDVNNDRPNFNGDLSLLRSRAPGEPIDPNILNLFSLPPIGQEGNLPRNAGVGPGQFIFDLNIQREFRLEGRMRLRPTVEIDNVFNQTVFSFGSEFIDFSAFAPTASAASRQAFLDSFLVTTRTLRPRTIRLGVRFDF
ncbi:MAG: TonB-dependent receptor [Pyrinomonadaceae bacterium]|nr:TonB-dependent receptor [Pyrinomonadaceae bacterium]